MSDDEILVLVVCSVPAALFLGGWYYRVFAITRLAGGKSGRLPLYVAPAGCLALLTIVLRVYADNEVRASLGYQVLFIAAWAVTAAPVIALASLLGFDPFGCGILQRNRAVRSAICGLWAGVTLCAAGANIGQGPTIYTTIGPMLMTSGAFVLLWLSFALLTGNADSVAIERDLASALRLAGLLVAWGLILGRAVAGDWVSWEATWNDFLQTGWPALALWALACVLEWMLRPGRSRSFSLPVSGILPAGLYLLSAIAWVYALGPW